MVRGRGQVQGHNQLAGSRGQAQGTTSWLLVKVKHRDMLICFGIEASTSTGAKSNWLEEVKKVQGHNESV